MALAATILAGGALYLLNIGLVIPGIVGISCIGRALCPRQHPFCRKARSRVFHWYDGIMYAVATDRYIRPAHERMAPLVGHGANVLDICCGPGTFALLVARKTGRVLGVDHAPVMVWYARLRQKKVGATNVEFEHFDARHLQHHIGSGTFDYATICMALHEKGC
jgi:ubiquinone/menaquinone biosynthesis C-methylase UbiE